MPGQATLGRYLVESEIGRGAMGAVLRGRDPANGRIVALKTLSPRYAVEPGALAEARERFFREARTAGRLHHPDIVTVHEAGEDRGVAFLAMEYLSGQDLQRHACAAQPLALDFVLGVGARVADALAYAHRQGVVHRDVKPANVMVDLPTGSVKVTDFGIARCADAARTRTGMVLGTPSFMSPEQMLGQRVDGRSDLYSLGVMLFQLLCGQLPHPASSMATLMSQIAHQPAPDIRSQRPQLPANLAELIARLLEKRPELRPADGHQLASALRQCGDDLAAPRPAVDAPEKGGSKAQGPALPAQDPMHNPPA